MTGNLVQRLRDLAEKWFEMCDDIHEPLYEAADRIEAQTDVLKKARTDLQDCVDDLEAEIEARRGTVLERITERDLASVKKGRAALEALAALEQSK